MCLVFYALVLQATCFNARSCIYLFDLHYHVTVYIATKRELLPPVVT